MLKKKITYTDYNGMERNDDFYFNMTEREIVMLLARLGVDDMKEYANKLVESGDAKAMFSFIDDIILSSIGAKSEDGKRFVKNQKIRDDFEQSEAYNVLFMDFLQNPSTASSFASAIVAKAKSKPSLADAAKSPIAGTISNTLGR